MVKVTIDDKDDLKVGVRGWGFDALESFKQTLEELGDKIETLAREMVSEWIEIQFKNKDPNGYLSFDDEADVECNSTISILLPIGETDDQDPWLRVPLMPVIDEYIHSFFGHNATEKECCKLDKFVVAMKERLDLIAAKTAAFRGAPEN